MKKGIIQVFFANIIFLIISLATNLVLPKYLSVDSYAVFKTYALYVGYAGFFHFGYNDGMYLKYGGMDLKSIKEEDFGKNFYNYVLLEGIVSVISIVVGILTDDKIICAFGAGLLATNVIGYFKSFYQSIGEFKLYGASLNLEKIGLLLIYIYLLFFIRSDNASVYIWTQIIIEFIIAFFLVIYLNQRYKFLREVHFSFGEISINIKKGFILMIGNFANTFFTGIDRWFVKLLMNSACFATYSFSVSMENMLNVFVTPISVTMYNDFAGNPDKEHIKNVKSIVLLWGPLIMAAAFPCKFFLEHFMVKYESASNIIFLLFATQAFYVVIKGIYVNYYKVANKQQKYLVQVLSMTGISIIGNLSLYYLFHSMEAIATATLVTAGIWFFACESSDCELRYNKREVIGLLSAIVLYLLCGFKFEAVIGLIIYILGLSGIVAILMRRNAFLIIKYVIGRKSR